MLMLVPGAAVSPSLALGLLVDLLCQLSMHVCVYAHRSHQTACSLVVYTRHHRLVAASVLAQIGKTHRLKLSLIQRCV